MRKQWKDNLDEQRRSNQDKLTATTSDGPEAAAAPAAAEALQGAEAVGRATGTAAAAPETVIFIE